jgi:hypothetical protein
MSNQEKAISWPTKRHRPGNDPVDPFPRSGPVAGYSPAAARLAEEKIRWRAYELYEQRGRADGHDEEDWLQAEREVLSTALRTVKTR